MLLFARFGQQIPQQPAALENIIFFSHFSRSFINTFSFNPYGCPALQCPHCLSHGATISIVHVSHILMHKFVKYLRNSFEWGNKGSSTFQCYLLKYGPKVMDPYHMRNQQVTRPSMACLMTSLILIHHLPFISPPTQPATHKYT